MLIMGKEWRYRKVKRLWKPLVDLSPRSASYCKALCAWPWRRSPGGYTGRGLADPSVRSCEDLLRVSVWVRGWKNPHWGAVYRPQPSWPLWLQLLSSVFAAWKQPQTTWKQMYVDAWQQKFMNANTWISWTSMWNSPLLWFFSQPFKKGEASCSWLPGHAPVCSDCMSLCPSVPPLWETLPPAVSFLENSAYCGHGGFHLVYMPLFIEPISVGEFYWFQFSQRQKCYNINLCYFSPLKTDILQVLNAHCQTSLPYDPLEHLMFP